MDEDSYDTSKLEYIAYTDGSCDNMNQYHAGGAAYVIIKDGEVIRAKNKSLMNTSNNRAEMLAIVSATLYTPEGSRLDIFTDSQYAMNVLSGKWRAKANLDLYDQFQRYARNLKMIVFHWVRGHNGDMYNEMVDDMAWSAYKDIITRYGIEESPWARGGYQKKKKTKKKKNVEQRQTA